VTKENKKENVKCYVNVDSVDVARLLMADPQEQVWSVGVTLTKSTCVKEVASIAYAHEHVCILLEGNRLKFCFMSIEILYAGIAISGNIKSNR